MASSHRGSPGNLVPVPSAMGNFDSQWAADGWTAGGWSSWTGGNGGDDQARRITSDAMQKRIEKLEARVSILEEEVAAFPAFRKAEQAAGAASVLPEPKAHECAWPERRADAPPLGEAHVCAWHQDPADAPPRPALPMDGSPAKDPDAWQAHLRSTLYSLDSRPLDAIGSKITANWGAHRSHSLQDTSQPLLLRAVQAVWPVHLWGIWRVGRKPE